MQQFVACGSVAGGCTCWLCTMIGQYSYVWQVPVHALPASGWQSLASPGSTAARCVGTMVTL